MNYKIAKHKRPKKKKERRILSSDDDDIPFLGALAAGASAIGGLYSAYKGSQAAGQYSSIDTERVKRELAPWQQGINKMQSRSEDMFNRADQFFDPRSDYYNQQRQQMREQIAGQTANVGQQQNQLMAQRGMGGGGISGLLGAVNAAQAGESTRQGMLGMQQQGIGLGMRQQSMGSSLLSSATGQQASLSENIAQGYISNVEAANAAQQGKAAALSGIGSGLLSSAGTMFGSMYSPPSVTNINMPEKI
jgi:hypothetical protein